MLVGAVLGTFMSGLLPGLGSGNGIGAQIAGTDDSAEPVESLNEVPPDASKSQADASGESIEITPPAVLEVRIDNHEYLISDGNGDFQPTTLDDVIKRARSTTGNDDGIRVRILRTRSARFAAWSALYDSLEEAGLLRDSIRMPKELID